MSCHRVFAAKAGRLFRPLPTAAISSDDSARSHTTASHRAAAHALSRQRHQAASAGSDICDSAERLHSGHLSARWRCSRHDCKQHCGCCLPCRRPRSARRPLASCCCRPCFTLRSWLQERTDVPLQRGFNLLSGISDVRPLLLRVVARSQVMPAARKILQVGDWRGRGAVPVAIDMRGALPLTHVACGLHLVCEVLSPGGGGPALLRGGATSQATPC